MSNILRPSAESFRRAGWIAANRKPLLTYISSLITSAENSDDDEELLPPVRQFIEKDPTVFADFVRMFEGATETESAPRGYEDLIRIFNKIFRRAPTFGNLGLPVYMIMVQNMNTKGGFSAYTKTVVNDHFKKMLETWVFYLNSKDSRHVLTDVEDGGWFSSNAMRSLMAEYPERSFEQVFICDSNEEYYGFTSFEDFFIRRYREPETDRPTGPLDDLRLISAPCESTTYAYQQDVQLIDKLFIKDEKYSLLHLLADDPYTPEFVGGSILQGFLNTTGYHRWHSPVNGVVKKVVSVPGTYFVQAPNTIDSIIPPPESEELPPYLRSLRFFANTNTRMLIFIKADNTNLGLVCFIAIGMTEISSCEATVYEGQHVVRGDELGTFHFGGSSCALVFRAAAKVAVRPEYIKPGAVLRINEVIADAPLAS